MESRGAVLVTGASGSVGFNIARCLREALPEVLIVTGCVMPLGPCFLFPIFDVRYVLPRFDKDPVQHIQRLRDLVLRYRIDSIIPGSDADVALLSLYRDVLADTSAR